MASTREKFIYKLAQIDELKNNVISWVFAYNPSIDTSSKEEFFDNVRSFYESFKDEKPDIEFPEDEDQELLETWKNLDLRIKQARFKSIKGYPPSDKPFGINFTKQDEPQSMIVLGANASGKSSIFEIMEYVYCKEIGEVDLRKYEEGNKDRYKLYLENYSNGTENIYGTIQAVDKLFDVQNEVNIPEYIRNLINPETHFISDHDIYYKGQLDFSGNKLGSFHRTIAQSLGFSEQLLFNKELNAFVNYGRRSETIKINKTKRNIKNQKKFISESEESKDKKLKRIKILEEANESIVSPDEEHKLQQELITKIENIKNNIFKFSFDKSEFGEITNTYVGAYKEYSATTRRSISTDELDFLQKGLSQIRNFNDCPFCEESKLGKDEIVQHVETRIKELEKKNALKSKLNRSLEELLNLLENISDQIISIIHAINKENEEISKFTELSELFEHQSYFENKVYEIISEEMLDDISNLDMNKAFIQNKQGYIYEFLMKNKELVKNFSDLEDFMNRFFDEKKQILEELEIQISKDIETQDRSKVEELVKLKTEVSKIKEQISTAKENLKADERKLREYQREKNLFEEIQKETSKYQEVVSRVLNNQVNESFSPIKLIVEEILEEYFTRQNRDVELVIKKVPGEIDEDSGEVISEKIVAFITKKNEKNSIYSVKKYLNTFHYRLFLTMVGISIAVASRIKTGINLPLVLDDIFYASDFENRAAIEVFIKSLFVTFDKFARDKKLQLILFTHDQLMFNSVNKVISELSILENSEIAFAKLLHYNNSIEEKDFKNVLYKFEENYRRKIIQREFGVV